MIELVLDFVSINSYLALNPAKRLADDLGVELKLTPLRTTSELGSVANSPDAGVAERHRQVRAKYKQLDAMRYAAVQGLKIAIVGNDCDSSVALRGLLAAQDQDKGFDFANTVFQRYWVGELELDSPSEILEVLKEVGIREFNDSDPRWDLEHIRAEMDEREISSVPTFWVNGERYSGRQHLPMIRWQLGRYEGAGPL
ncbi:MAG: DsbA family protein [Gammaproteobacteria bacterium]|nr:DsbA family protein [Gammaproteobacteria bacterium]